jgi:hypothetical protein
MNQLRLSYGDYGRIITDYEAAHDVSKILDQHTLCSVHKSPIKIQNQPNYKTIMKQ